MLLKNTIKNPKIISNFEIEKLFNYTKYLIILNFVQIIFTKIKIFKFQNIKYLFFCFLQYLKLNNIKKHYVFILKNKNNNTLIQYIITIKLTNSNIIINITNTNKNLIFSYSSGILEFKGSQKIKHFALINVVKKTKKFIKKFYLTNFAIHFKGLKKNRQKIFDYFKKFLIVKKIKIFNNIPHNGCRKKKLKRDD